MRKKTLNQVQEAQRIPYRLNPKRNKLRHMLIKLENIKDKEKNIKSNKGRRSQDGGGVGQGEHFLPYKFIKRAFKRQVNSKKQLLNAGRGHQAPRKATQVFERR